MGRYYKKTDAAIIFFEGVLVTDEKQVVNPTHEQILASGWQEYVEPEPTEEDKLRMAIKDKIAEIDAYSNSDAVNDLTYNGVHTWLTPEVRANYKVSIDAADLLGEQTITFAIGEQAVTAPLGVVKMMLAKIQRYADATYMVSVGHKANVAKLGSVAEVEEYDYTKGYPEKLAF